MRTLVQSGDTSFLLSVQIALEANGIRYLGKGTSHVGVLHSVVQVEDEDFEHATAIVGELQRTN